MQWISLFPAAELVENMARSVRVSGKKIVLVRQGDRIFALEDRCSHEEVALSQGFIEPGKICCTMHGAAFDLATGAALTPPAYEPVKSYPITIEDGIIKIQIP